uniref:Endonuclease/exonuclease/phosphatase domain-containing protein n=1 Tax=Glossina austeni TaxID=7395 RepID=A0A1A9UDP0_GLOAU
MKLVVEIFFTTPGIIRGQAAASPSKLAKNFSHFGRSKPGLLLYNCLDNDLQVLDDVSITYENILLCGDINVDLDFSDSRSNEFHDSISTSFPMVLGGISDHEMFIFIKDVDINRKCGGFP